jgi:ABC-type branched-subunit amino acid transport system ATPase component
MTLLDVTDLKAGYGQAEVLHGISLTVGEGEIVVILGANGAGKTTTLRAVAGLIGRRGTVRIGGTTLRPGVPAEAVAAGLSLVPQGRGTFTRLTVQENLLVGATKRRDKASVARDIEDGTAMLIVEQNAELALDLASRVYLLETGEVVSSGAAADLRHSDSVRRAYLGY